MIALEKINLNKIGEYTETVFYPKNYVLASGEFNWVNKDGKICTISMSVMKINETQFTTMGHISCSNISSAEECRNTFATDKELNDNYYEDLTPENIAVTLVYEAELLIYHTITFTTDELTTIDEILNYDIFNKILEQWADELLNTDKGKYWE